MPLPLLFALPPLITWAAGGAVATGAVVGAAALDRRTHSRNASAASNAELNAGTDPTSNPNAPPPQPTGTITEDHTPAIRNLEAALVNLMTALQSPRQVPPTASSDTSAPSINDATLLHGTNTRRASTSTSTINAPTTNQNTNNNTTHHTPPTDTRPRAQTTTRPPTTSPLTPLLIWTRRILARLSSIHIGRDADSVAQSIRERLDELVRRMVMAQALFMGEEWRAVRGVFLAVDELGRVLGRRVVGVVEGVGRLGEGIDDAGTLPGVRELGAGELGNGQGRRGGTLITAAGSARDEVGSDGVQDDDGGGEDEGGGVVLGAAGGNVDLARIT